MKQLVSIVLLLGASYFASQNWPAITVAFHDGPSQISAPSWGERDVAGLKLDLPCSLASYSPPQTAAIPSYIRFESFRGKAGDSQVFVTHFTNTRLVGGVMLTWADRPLGAAASKLALNVISTNSATTIIGGMRARRSDYVSASGNPRTRVRCLLLERGNRMWLIECHAPESDAGAEDDFLKIARSAQEF